MGHVNFRVESTPSGVMDSTMVVADWTQQVESLYRDDGDRLWRALHAWAGDPDVASEAVRSIVRGVLAIDQRMMSLLQLDHILPASPTAEAA